MGSLQSWMPTTPSRPGFLISMAMKERQRFVSARLASSPQSSALPLLVPEWVSAFAPPGQAYRSSRTPMPWAWHRRTRLITANQALM